MDATNGKAAIASRPLAMPPSSSTTAARPPSRSRPGSAAATAAAPKPPLSPTKRSSPQGATATSLSTTSGSKTSLLYAQPSSVHFGGFALDQTYMQRIFVHNNSAKPIRLQYLLPTKPPVHFRVRFPNDRKPIVSPGLFDELLVTFHPTAFQYYYDCIHVKCEQVAYASNTDAALTGACLIPLHAYPVLNQVDFPSRMDFGVVALGATARRHVELTCSVPIEFEYELRVVHAHASFTIFPLRGVIPPHGTARIEVEFKPLLYATTSAEIELHVSQLGFTPMRCVLTGSSTSDVASGQASSDESASSAKSPTKRPGSSSGRPRTADRSGGGGSLLPPSPQAPAKNNNPRSPPRRKRAHQAGETKPSEPDETDLDMDLTKMATVNFLLTQQPGKLKPKDLKKAIDANRLLRAQQNDDQNKLCMAATDSNSSRPEDDDQGDHGHDENRHDANGVAPVSPAVLTFHVLLHEEASTMTRATMSRQIREMVATQELSEIELLDKQLEFQSHQVRLGQELLTSDQLAILTEMRAMNTLAFQRHAREKWRQDVESKAFHLFTPPTKELPYPPRGMLPAHFKPAFCPDFKSYKNDLWSRRKRVVQRLVRAISTVVIRLRAQSRLEKIKKWIGQATTKLQVKEKVALDWQQQKQTSSSSSGGSSYPSSASAKASGKKETHGPALFMTSFPLVEEKDHRAPRVPVALASHDWDLANDPFEFFPLEPQDEALVMGHEPLDLPVLPTYVPLEATRPLRSGACDECTEANGPPRPATSSLAQHGPKDLAMPGVLDKQLPRDVFLRPSAAFRPLVRLQSTRETDVAFALRPQRVFRSTPRHWGLELTTSVGTRSLASRQTGLLCLSDTYEPRTERTRGPSPLLVCLSDDQDSGEGDNEPVGTGDATLYRSVWDVTSDGFVPPLSERADDVVWLSDSESDDDEHTTKHLAPTWQDAQLLWDSEQQEQKEQADDEDDGVAYEPGEFYGKRNGVHSFARYRHLIQSERAYNIYRDEKLEQLPTMLTKMAELIHHPDYQLVVHGHGPSRPLHAAPCQ